MNQKNQDLQTLRGIAILMVLFFHLSISATIITSLHLRTNPFYWGVELFFVLSGYVVTKSLHRKLYDPLNFTLKRIFRLFPAIIALLIIAALINGFYQKAGFGDFMNNLLTVSPDAYIKNALSVLGGYLVNSPEKVSYQLGQMWTLSVEFQFYAVTALLLFVTPPKFRPKSYAICATMILVGCLIFRFQLSFGIQILKSRLFEYFVHNEFDFMAAGVLLAFVPEETLQSIMSPFKKPMLGYLVLIITTVVLFCVRGEDVQETSPFDSLRGPGMLAALVGSLFVVAYGAVGGFSEAKISRWPELILAKIGDVSFTIYLMHFTAMLIAWVVIAVCIPSAFSQPYFYGITQLVITILILIPIVNYIYKKIELPGIEMGNSVIRFFYLGSKKASVEHTGLDSDNIMTAKQSSNAHNVD